MQAGWAATAEEIKADILEHGLTDQGVLRQHYATDALDASTLLAAIFGFLPDDDERLRASVLAIADELTEHGFVLRYRTDETDDGLSGKEGTFLICSFWLVSALAIIGEEQRARDLMERLLRVASPLGLYAEEFDTDTGRHLGNFPQAFSHLALIEAAARIILAEMLEEISVTDSYDVIIIGSGAGGGTLAHHLAPSGQANPAARARGLAPARAAELARRRASSSRTATSRRRRGTTRRASRSSRRSTTSSAAATKLYGAALYRLRREDFGELRHHDGISPAWPISYDELEPYYSQAEQLYQVHGARGEDPTEPDASAPYPHPAVSHEPRIQQLSDDLAGAGYHPFHAPCGILLDEANMAYSTCVRCPNCDGFPCPLHAKSDAEVIGVRPALEHPNVTLLRNARAVRLDTNEEGTAVTGVVVERDGETETFAGDLVVVSCGAANSAKLLLESASDKHPNGLANGSDQVGRNFMFHDSQAVLALSREENPTVFQKTLGLNDFYFGTDDFEYPLGNVQMVGKSQAPMFRGEKPVETRLAPRWSLERIARHAIDFWLSTEDLPKPDNRVTRRRRRQGDAELRGDERRPQEAAVRQGEVDPRAAGHEPGAPRPPLRVHEDRDPGRRVRAPGRHVQVRERSGHLGAEHRLPRARAGQPLRGRHELLPLDRRREPGADGDGQRAPRRRPPAGPNGVTPATDVQVEIAAADQLVGVDLVGGGLRSYSVGGRELLDGYSAGEASTSGRGQVLIPWPNRLEDGAYEFDGLPPSAAAHRAGAGERDPRPRA